MSATILWAFLVVEFNTLNFSVGLQHQHTDQICVPAKPGGHHPLGQDCPVGWTQWQCESWRHAR
jgi:hypothetical protein